MLRFDQLPQSPYILPQAEAEALTGRRLPTSLFRCATLGHRILVVLEPPRTRIGRIHLASQSQKNSAWGRVIAAGDLVGQKWSPSGECTGYWPIYTPAIVGYEKGSDDIERPMVRTFPAPWTILGARVFLYAFSGDAVPVEPDDTTEADDKSWVDKLEEMGMGGQSLEYWKSPFKVATDNDVVFVDTDSVAEWRKELTATTGGATVALDGTA
jgi:hypothetical protein